MKRFAVLFFFSAFFFSACGTARWVPSPVLKEKNIIISMEQRQENGQIVAQKYDHPYTVDLLEFKKLLEDVTYVEQIGFLGKEEKKQVFQAIEINRLVSVLANTLTKIDASQRIRFTSFNKGKGWLFSIRRKTEGVIFIKHDGRLNMAFNHINFEINPNDANTLPPDFSRLDPLKITTSDTPLIPTPTYAELHQFENGTSAPMWLVADLEKLDKATDTVPVTRIETVDKAPLKTPEPEILSVPAAPSAKQIDITITETTKKTTAPATDIALQKDIKNKLKYLKELRDEGLISEQDYNTKKTELLNKID
jgi:hypothetical protein